MNNKNAKTQKSKAKTVLTVLLKIALTLIIIAGILLLGSFIALLLISEGIHMPLPYIAGYLLPALLLPVIWLKQKKKYMKGWWLLILLFVVVAGVDFGVIKYTESISVRTSSYNYSTDDEDAFVFIVHKDNPIDSLTTEQIQGIYSGEITNWEEVGGENKTIKAYQCDADSDTQGMMELFMGEIPLMQAPTQWGYGYLYAWGRQVSDYRNKPDCIGFCLSSSVEGNADVKLLCIDGAAPTPENIENGSYPFDARDYAAADEETPD